MLLPKREEHPKLYACECSRLIKRDHCISIQPVGGGVEVNYFCCCIGPGVHTLRVDFRAQAFYAIAGAGALVPWTNPAPYRPVEDDNPELVTFRAGMNYVDTLEDLKEFWGPRQ